MTWERTRWREPSRLVGIGLIVSIAVVACSANGEDGGTTSQTSEATLSDSTLLRTDSDMVVIAADGVQTGWEDYGWKGIVNGDDPVQVDLSDYGGWIVASPDLEGTYSALVVNVSAPPSLGDRFMNVQLGDSFGTSFPTVRVPFESVDGEELQAVVPMYGLLLGTSSFDRVVLSAEGALDAPAIVTINELALVRGDPSDGRSIEDDVATASIDCAAPTTVISPHIYGTARPGDSDNDWQWTLDLPSRRWGGNPTSRYNWTTGTWNTAIDYYWENVDVSSDDGPAHEVFLDDNAAHDALSAVTVPMLGWVAKDDTSHSFSVERFGEQESVDGHLPDAGNGVTPSGDPIDPPDPDETSVPSTPEMAERWIASMVTTADATGRARPFMYFLDNEPMLWNSTHRDVFPDPLGYEELLARSIVYATAIKAADPQALVAGPTSWGWPAYFYSAIDAEQGYANGADYRSHGDKPLIEWYLEQMRLHEEETGTRLLDVLDVHFYPQDGSYGDSIDADSAALRIRSTRSLWDSDYKDESWIGQPIRLIPRMHEWVDVNYPGTKLSIGEYSFGAEHDMSGALAEAEALGHFGEGELFSAYYWVTPPDLSPVYWAFRAYRDYDGRGSQFGDRSVPAESSDPLSIFASTTEAGDRHVVVALNTSPDVRLDTSISIDGCDRTTVSTYQYDGSENGLEPVDSSIADHTVEVTLEPYSISVIELR